MNNKEKRILWLINHTTLRAFEVPLLRSLGYEVYTSKLYPNTVTFRSGSTDYSYDEALTIPKDVIDILNSHDFYSQAIPPEIAKYMNQYFGTVFCGHFLKMMDQLFERFNGRILPRIFGYPDDSSFFDLNTHYGLPGFRRRLAKNLDRVWFAQLYENLSENEPDIYQRRAVTLPPGLPREWYVNQDSWNGQINEVLFVFPEIGIEYSRFKKYKKFKREFSDIPHIIVGKQDVPINDPQVLGFIEQTKYISYMQNYAVMFYENEAQKHLHYHPIEAMMYGMPVVFMRSGMLGILGGKDYPGAAGSYREARKKIERILKKNTNFIQEIKESQKTLLHYFSYEYNLGEWESKFVNSIMASTVSVKPKVQSMAIFCYAQQTSQEIEIAKKSAMQIIVQSREAGEGIEIVLGIQPGIFNIKEEFSELISAGVSIREVYWKKLSSKEIKVAQEFSGYARDLVHNEYLNPSDRIVDFQNCDRWLFFSENLPAPIAPIKSSGLIINTVPLESCMDHENFLKNLRMYDFYLTWDDRTKSILTSTMGLSPYQIGVIPDLRNNQSDSVDCWELIKEYI